MGPFAQGPVALIARHGDECVFSSDALGLRPLWKLETPNDFIFSSEPGVVGCEEMVSEPKPLGPGEKFMVTIDSQKRTSRLYEHWEMQRAVAKRWLERTGASEVASYDRALRTGGPLEGPEIPGYSSAGPSEPVKVDEGVLAGFGWQRDDVKLCQQMASNGAEPIGSLGYDGPLAALSPERQNLADYFKETVAVVTNPAIDREREIEHFSTRAVFGRRPSLHAPATDTGTVETSFPVVLGGHHDLAPLSDSTYRKIAREHETYLLEDLWEEFRNRAAAIDIALLESETTHGAIERIKQEALKCVRHGAELLVLTDRTVYDGVRRYLDPHLATSAVDQALKQLKVGETGEENLRRRCSIVLRSAAIRNVHDVVMALGPRGRRRLPLRDGRGDLRRGLRRRRLQPLLGAPQGDREGDLDDRHPRGARVRPAVLLDRSQAGARRDLPVRDLLRLREGPGSGSRTSMCDTDQRFRVLCGEKEAKPAKTFRFYPKVYKAAVAASNGSESYEEYSRKVRGLERREPDLDAPHRAAARRSRAGRSAGRGRLHWSPRLPDRDLLDELRLAVRAGLPRLRRGGEGHQHSLHQRGGRGDPGHVRQVPQVARAAGRLRPLRGLCRDAELLLRRRDQDRAGREARRGRTPAGSQGVREGRRGAERVAGHRPDLPLEQPRPLLDRGPCRS